MRTTTKITMACLVVSSVAASSVAAAAPNEAYRPASVSKASARITESYREHTPPSHGLLSHFQRVHESARRVPGEKAGTVEVTRRRYELSKSVVEEGSASDTTKGGHFESAATGLTAQQAYYRTENIKAAFAQTAIGDRTSLPYIDNQPFPEAVAEVDRLVEAEAGAHARRARYRLDHERVNDYGDVGRKLGPQDALYVFEWTNPAGMNTIYIVDAQGKSVSIGHGLPYNGKRMVTWMDAPDEKRHPGLAREAAARQASAGYPQGVAKTYPFVRGTLTDAQNRIRVDGFKQTIDMNAKEGQEEMELIDASELPSAVAAIGHRVARDGGSHAHARVVRNELIDFSGAGGMKVGAADWLYVYAWKNHQGTDKVLLVDANGKSLAFAQGDRADGYKPLAWSTAPRGDELR